MKNIVKKETIMTENKAEYVKLTPQQKTDAIALCNSQGISQHSLNKYSYCQFVSDVKEDFVLDMLESIMYQGYAIYRDNYDVIDIDVDVESDGVKTELDFTVEVYDEQEKANDMLSEKLDWGKLQEHGFLCINGNSREVTLMFEAFKWEELGFTEFLTMVAFTDRKDMKLSVSENNMSYFTENKILTEKEIAAVIELAKMILLEYTDIFLDLLDSLQSTAKHCMNALVGADLQKNYLITMNDDRVVGVTEKA